MATYKIGDFLEIEELEDVQESQELVIDSSQFQGQEIKYYQNNLQGKKVNNPVIGEVLLNKKGRHETAFKGTKKYLAVICFIDKLIETGTCNGQMEQPKHPRNDGFIGFYIIENIAIYDGKKIKIKITIGVDSIGNKYYVFNAKGIHEDLPISPAAWVEPTNQVEQVHDLIINDVKENVKGYFKKLKEDLEKYLEK